VEFQAPYAALDRMAADGLAATIARHTRAATATRAGLEALGLPHWVTDPAQASALVTTATLPTGTSLADASPALLEAVSPAIGTPPGVIRFNHTGPRATEASVAAGLAALADHLGRGGALPLPGRIR
jgi:aspartate aminotransferase-like enzyme